MNLERVKICEDLLVIIEKIEKDPKEKEDFMKLVNCLVDKSGASPKIIVDYIN